MNLEFSARDNALLSKASALNEALIIERLFEAAAANNLPLSSLLERRAVFLSLHSTRVTVYPPIVAIAHVIFDIYVK